jgi:TRAP-type mannitol/chloroaromatic compound transport system substrate-binding protein
MKCRSLIALRVAVAVFVGLIVIGCPSQAIAKPSEVINWKFQSHHTPGALSTEYVIPPFIERVREMSGGRLNITLHYAGELVDYQEVFPSLQANMIQMANTSGLFWRGSIPVGWLQSGNLPPFVCRSNDEFNELYHRRGIDALIREGLAEQGIHFLGNHNVGNTYFWSKKPINSVDDLKGFKVRFFGSMSDTMEHFGAAPVMLPHPETYTAIAMGTLDGSGTAWWLYRDLKLHEVCPYFIGPAWQTPQGMELWVSKKAWDALPDDLKAIVETAAVAFTKDYVDICWMQEREMFNKSFPEWGTTYIEWGKEDIDRITNEFSLPYLDKIAKEIGPKDPRVVKGIEIIKQFMKDYGYID